MMFYQRVISNLEVNREQCSIYYIIIVLLELKYVEIDIEIFPIVRIHKEICKVTQTNARPRIWISTVNSAVFIISLLEYLSHTQVCGHTHRNLSDKTNPAWDMESHAKKLVTLNLKVNG